MQRDAVQFEMGLRVWQDERLDRAWRVAYREGDDETIVTFPDEAAMGDFIVEHLGIALLERGHEPYEERPELQDVPAWKTYTRRLPALGYGQVA